VLGYSGKRGITAGENFTLLNRVQGKVGDGIETRKSGKRRGVVYSRFQARLGIEASSKVT